MGAETRRQAQAGISKADEALLLDVLTTIRRNLSEAEAASDSLPAKQQAAGNA